MVPGGATHRKLFPSAKVGRLISNNPRPTRFVGPRKELTEK